MRFIARIAMRGPLFAAGTAAALLLASPLLGLLLMVLMPILSGAVVALATLRHGAFEGLKVIGMASALAVVVRLAVSGDGLPMLVLCMMVWMPSWLLAVVLARTSRQAAALVLAGLLAANYAILMRIAVPDLTVFWLTQLTPVFELFAAVTSTTLSDEQMRFVASQMHARTLTALVCMLVSIVLLARYWQAALYNPGGFGTEFCALRLPRVLSLVTGAAALAWLAARAAGFDFGVAGDAFVILVVLFAFQGLAVIHHRARAVELAAGWLVGLYTLLVIMPQVMGAVLATAGMIDSVVRFRERRSAP